jgi:ABC-type lipoprotein export system ATPase subunit
MHKVRSIQHQNNPLPIVVGRDIQKTFRLGEQWIHALNQVALEIPHGQFVGIMGPSGSGKSTLLYLLGGLDTPSAGEIIVAGQRLSGMTSEARARFRRNTIGFIFQAFHLVPTLTALENVGLPGVFAAMPRSERDRQAARLLNALGMGDRLDHRPSQLSGGQQQRVAIARALFNDPPIIMADEPTGALDSRTGRAVMRTLRTLCDKKHKTIIVVTHDPTISDYADRLLHLHDGRITDETRYTRKEAS